MSSPDDRPVKVTPERLFTLPGALLISVVVLAGALGIGWANLKAQVDEIPTIRGRVEEHDRALYKLDVMANDIVWIKQELQRQGRENYRRPAANGNTASNGNP